MRWLEFTQLLQITITHATESASPAWAKPLIPLTPILSFGISIVNLYLVIYIFRFTRNKNDRDRNIKWFQELVYTPNKERIAAYFENLRTILTKIELTSDIREEDKISLMTKVKEERNMFMNEFVDLIKLIAPGVHKEIVFLVDTLTDQLTTALDNDELKWNNPKTQQREVVHRVSIFRNKLYSALFNYKG